MMQAICDNSLDHDEKKKKSNIAMTVTFKFFKNLKLSTVGDSKMKSWLPERLDQTLL